MSNSLIIALAQMDLALGEPERNLETARSYVRAAQTRGADLIVLPELWSSAYDLERAMTLASPRDAGMFAATAQLAREHRLAIVGSLLETDGTHVFNCATLFDAHGHLVGAYRKLHLVPMLDEHRFLTGGTEAPVFEMPFGKVALGVCYDLRFPELWRHYALRGVCIAFVPAEWPQKRAAHWRTLVPARAIENQMFFVACNRVGATKGERFGGGSLVVNPWGEILVEGDDRETLLIAQLDLAMVDDVRARVPVFRDRRPEIYSKWSVFDF